MNNLSGGMNMMNLGASGASVAGMSVGMNGYQGQHQFSGQNQTLQQDYGGFGSPNIPNQGYNTSSMPGSVSGSASASQASIMGYGMGHGGQGLINGGQNQG